MNALLRLSDRLRDRGRRRGDWNTAHADGKLGEDLAHRHLRAAGLTIVARNYRTATGSSEIDLVAEDAGTVVFVEVKTRATDAFGGPEEAVDESKRERLFRGAADYLRRTDRTWDDARFDIVAVVLGPPVRIQHLRDAFCPPC